MQILTGFFWNIIESIDMPGIVLDWFWAKQIDI